MILYAIVLAFEVLYYSLFMKFARRDGKLWRYILLFTLVNIFFFIVGTGQVYSYLLLILTILLGLKYIGKIKTTSYDMFFIFIMLIFKTSIETLITIPSYYILHDMFIATLIADFFKIGIIALIRNKIKDAYETLHIKWINNNFYIRYIFSIFMFLYVLLSCVFLIFNR